MRPRVLAVLPSFCGGIAFALVLYIVVSTLEYGELLFAWHPTLMGLAFLGFYANGALIYRTTPHEWALQRRRRAHMLLQIFGTVCAFTGAGVILYMIVRVEGLRLPDDAHGWAGVVTLTLCLLQGFMGVIKVAILPRRFRALRLHGRLGIFIVVAGAVTICLGVREYTNALLANSVAVSATYALIVIFLIAFLATRVRLPFPEDDSPDAVDELLELHHTRLRDTHG